MPTPSELRKAEEASPGSANLLVYDYLSARDRYFSQQEQEFRERVRQLQRINVFRLASLFCGMVLGLASLSVLTWGVVRGVDPRYLAVGLSPVAGIAGVFLWGYQPDKSGSGALPNVPPSRLNPSRIVARSQAATPTPGDSSDAGQQAGPWRQAGRAAPTTNRCS